MTSQKAKRILIVLPRQLGDVLLGTPLAQVLKRRFPTALIDWYAHPMAWQILEGNPYLHKIHYYPVWRKSSSAKLSRVQIGKRAFAFALNSVAFVLRLRRQRYDIVIDVMNNPRTAILSFLTGARQRISFSTHPLRNLAYHVVLDRTQMDQSGYLGHSRLFLLSPLGITPGKDDLLKLRPFLPLSYVDFKKPLAWLKTQLPGSARFFLLSPTHRRSVRQWPAKHYLELAMRLVQATGHSVVWMWGPGEDSFVKSLHEELTKRLKQESLKTSLSLLPPLLSLRECAVLSQKSLLWIGNSNGLSHIAVAADARTVEIHGPTNPKNWCHPDHKKHIALQRQEGCTRCESNKCSLALRECMESLSVDQVFAKIKEFMSF